MITATLISGLNLWLQRTTKVATGIHRTAALFIFRAVEILRGAPRRTTYATTVRRRDRATWQLLVLLGRHRIKTKLLFRDGTSSRANRKRYSPAYKGDGSMLHPQRNSAGNNPDVIPSAKATKGSALETAQKLSHQQRAAEDGIAALMRSVIGIAGFMLAIVSPTIASAATIEEVAHCRAVPQLAERLRCFKSLKPGPRAKTEDAAPEKKRHAGSSKVKDAARAKAKQAAPERAAPAKTDEAAPAKMEQAARRSKQHQRRRSKPHRSKPHQRRRSKPHQRIRTRPHRR